MKCDLMDFACTILHCSPLYSCGLKYRKDLAARGKSSVRARDSALGYNRVSNTRYGKRRIKPNL